MIDRFHCHAARSINYQTTRTTILDNIYIFFQKTFLVQIFLKVKQKQASQSTVTQLWLQLVATINKTHETGTIFLKKCLILPLTFLRLTNFKTLHATQMVFCLFPYMSQLYSQLNLALEKV